ASRVDGASVVVRRGGDTAAEERGLASGRAPAPGRVRRAGPLRGRGPGRDRRGPVAAAGRGRPHGRRAGPGAGRGGLGGDGGGRRRGGPPARLPSTARGRAAAGTLRRAGTGAVLLQPRLLRVLRLPA